MIFHIDKLDYYHWTECTLHRLSTKQSSCVYFSFSKHANRNKLLDFVFWENSIVASLVAKLVISALPW